MTCIIMIGMDLRMTPYSCLATGNQVGIIEFVHNAKTVYNIQRTANRFAAMQFDSSQLYKWIKGVSQKVYIFYNFFIQTNIFFIFTQ